MTLASIYVALSRSSGRETIRLLRAFDSRVLLQPLDSHLEMEDRRLDELRATCADKGMVVPSKKPVSIVLIMLNMLRLNNTMNVSNTIEWSRRAMGA